MIALLGFLLDGIELIGQYALWAIETGFNGALAALAAAATAALALLPGMPSMPSIGNPQWLDWANWFFPIGPLVGGLVAVVMLWIAYLAVRWVLRLVRAL
jgi:hypothetical protein